jgi:UDP-N-acetylmuramate--alanine ligase
MFFRPQHLHFTGIGGIGMSGIAEVLLNLGYTITGSDLRLSPITERLSGMGAHIYEGHNAEHIAGARALVVSSAVDEQNPELREARRLQIPVIPRGELLAELMRLKFGIAIAGSHGKTTTTSITATILAHAGQDPTVVVGGRVGSMGGSNARVGSSQVMVVESDESDRSFLKLAPIVAVVTNIDREHLDAYKSLEDIRRSFIEFVNKVPFYGAAILCLDDENVQGILPEVNPPHSDVRRQRASGCASSGHRLRGVRKRVYPAVPGRRPGSVPDLRSGAPQRAECRRCGGGCPGIERECGDDPRRFGGFHRGRPAFPD